MHIDGFRFDLASVLSRDSQGRTLRNPPILWDIESDPILAGCKLMAEAFAQMLIHHTVGRDTELRQNWTLSQLLSESEVTWHGTRLQQPDWRDLSHSLAFTVETPGHSKVLHGILNAFWESLEFELPPGNWNRWIDTSLAGPEDICAWGKGPNVRDRYLVQSRTVAFFTPARP